MRGKWYLEYEERGIENCDTKPVERGFCVVSRSITKLELMAQNEEVAVNEATELWQEIREKNKVPGCASDSFITPRLIFEVPFLSNNHI